MDKPTYEELLKENKRQALLSKKMATTISDFLDLLLDIESLLKSYEKVRKRVTEIIERR